MGNYQVKYGGEEPAFRNPGFGLWAQALSLQSSAGILMLYIGFQGGGLTEVEDDLEHPAELLSQGWRVVEVMGIFHILLAAFVSVWVVLGYLKAFYFPIPRWMISIFESLFCLASSGVCGWYLNHGYSSVEETYQSLFDSSKQNSVKNKEIKLYEKSTELVIAGALSLAALAPIRQVSFFKMSDPPNEVILVVLSTTLSAGCGAILLLPTNITLLIIMGVMWITVGVMTSFLLKVASKFSKRIGSIITAIALLVVAIIGIFTVVLLGVWYVEGRNMDIQDYGGAKLRRLGLGDERISFLMYKGTRDGTFMLLAIVLSMTQFYLCFFGSLVVFRFAFPHDSPPKEPDVTTSNLGNEQLETQRRISIELVPEGPEGFNE